MLRRPDKRNICIIVMICLSLLLPVCGFASDSGLKNNNSWFERQGKFVIDNGIIKGDENGEYSWDSFVKRGDMALMIFRAFNFSSTSGDSFKDVDAGSYYYDAITTARALGIAKGDGESFKPEDNVTLEEAILLIQRSVTVAAAYNNTSIRRDVNLKDIYMAENFSKYASRKDIADMLYICLSSDFTYSKNTELNNIYYNSEKNTTVHFNTQDFIDKYKKVSDSDLCFVLFNLPAANSGVLYYDYNADNSFNARVTSDKRYYSDEKYYPDKVTGLDISKVTFVPAKDFSGTLTIGYTASDGKGISYSGKIFINCKDTSSDMKTINYTVSKNKILSFSINDFYDAFEAVSDNELSYVMFTLPSINYGKLYYSYNNSMPELSGSVASGTKYYANARDGMVLTKISFAPSLDYTGPVVIEYTGYDKDNNLYKGKINITVE